MSSNLYIWLKKVHHKHQILVNDSYTWLIWCIYTCQSKEPKWFVYPNFLSPCVISLFDNFSFIVLVEWSFFPLVCSKWTILWRRNPSSRLLLCSMFCSDLLGCLNANLSRTAYKDGIFALVIRFKGAKVPSSRQHTCAL